MSSPLSTSFHTTRWTQVARAKAPTNEGREALRDLCASYYSPVIAFLRRETRDAAQARELAHDFFALVLEGEAFEGADPGRGRFRSYLLGAVKHFLSNRRQYESRLRRGAGVQPLPIELDAEDSPPLQVSSVADLSPDAAFDRQWALTLIEHTLSRLRSESAAQGDAELFDRLQPLLTGESMHGDQAALADGLGLKPNTLKSILHRLRQRFRALLKAEIASTLEDANGVADEMAVLFAALRSA